MKDIGGDDLALGPTKLFVCLESCNFLGWVSILDNIEIIKIMHMVNFLKL